MIVSLSTLILITTVQEKAATTPNPLATEAFIAPPREIQDYFDQPRHLNYTLNNLSRDKKWFARVVSNGGVKLSDIGNPYENFAGIMIDPKANRARTLSYRTATSIQLTSAEDFSTRLIKAPEGAWLSSATWSPDGKKLMYLVHTPNQSTVWVYDPALNTSEAVSETPLLATAVNPEWSGDSKTILAVTIPTNRKAVPAKDEIAAQPKVQLSDPSKNRLRVFRTLLQNERDQQRFEYFLTGQLTQFNLAAKKSVSIGSPAMYLSIDSAPKGDFFRVQTMQKPFSYLVPASSFGRKEEVIDASGKSLTVLNETKLSTTESSDGPPQNPRRNLSWAPDGNGFWFTRTQPKPEKKEEKKDGVAGLEFPILTAHIPTETGWEIEQGRRGAPDATAPASAVREPEELVLWKAPFRKEDEVVVLTRKNGFAGLQVNQNGSAIYVVDSENGASVTKRVTLEKESKEEALWTVKPREQSPGSIVSSLNSFGVSSVDETNGKLILRGVNNTQNEEKEPSRPFLNVFDLKTKKTDKVWQSEEKAFQNVDAILDINSAKFVINHQSPTETPNSFLFEGGKRAKQLTQNKDYAPDLSQAIRKRIQVTRADGFKFWVKVTMPTWKIDGVKLPAFFWFYPSEFENQEAYDRGARAANPNLFPVLGGSPKALLLRRGYVLVEPDCPIVGPKGRINDYYVNDLRNSLYAVVEALDAQGIADRNKLSIGGHSYGGFSTANAMIHTPFFKAGIAGAGNYNRTLTPFAFQSESRTLWEAREMYLNMSPLLYAENLTGAMLMYAGMDDQNVGTDPINSVKMFGALEAVGKTTALYMYPYEDHGQIARETLLDQWARWIPWLDKYVLGK